jgi:hypothetical protein
MRALQWVAGVLLIVPSLVACGAADQASQLGPTNVTGAGGSGGAGGGTDADAASSTTGAGAGGSAPTVCPDASSVHKVQPAQSNMLFAFDRSGSMHLRVGTKGDTRWTLTKAGFFQLLDSLPPTTVGGLGLFPYGDKPISCCKISSSNTVECNCTTVPATTARCDSKTYQKPPVALAALDSMHIQAIKAKVTSADKEFYWGTPLAPALKGAIDSLGTAKHAGVSSVVLLTDGEPTSCDTKTDPKANDIQRAIDAVSAGVNSGVRTYVVGVYDGASGANEGNLSKIALAGDTARYAGCEAKQDCAYPVNVKSFTTDLQKALESIALEAMSCTFDLPSVMGGDPDFDHVNITITANKNTLTVPQDSSHKDGWDYLAGHKQVQLYGAACEKLKSDATAEVQVVVGCKTVGN